MEFVEGGQVNDRAYMEKNRIDVNEVRWGLVLGHRGTEGQSVDGTVCLGLGSGALEPGPLPLQELNVYQEEFFQVFPSIPGPGVGTGTSFSEHEAAAGFFPHSVGLLTNSYPDLEDCSRQSPDQFHRTMAKKGSCVLISCSLLSQGNWLVDQVLSPAFAS